MSLMNHEAGRLCLLEVNEILHKFLPSFFLMQGTALGAYRDKGFVPTERDIDVGVLQEHLQPKAWMIMEELMVKGFDVECFVMPFTRPRTVVAFKQYDVRHNPLQETTIAKVDIVGMVPIRSYRFTTPPVRSYVDKPYALVHDRHSLEDYMQVRLFGELFNLPADVENYLKLEYGPTWRTPQDDHVSRTRVYNFVKSAKLPRNFLEQFDQK